MATRFLTWFDYPRDSALLLFGTYDPYLVVLSVLLSVFAASMALQMAGQARHSHHRPTRFLILLTGSLALGGGVWAMHFVGMLSFALCANVRYDRVLTLVSFLPGFFASGIALHLLSHAQVRLRQLVIGGTLVGCGIGAMHYTGMAAMEMAPLLRIDPLMFVVSLGVAVVLAILGFWIRFRVRWQSELASVLLGGCVLGLAINAMHYTGMAAARFVGVAELAENNPTNDATFIALTISALTIALTLLVLVVNGLLRYRELFRRLRYQQLQHKTIFETAIESLILFDGDGVIRDINPAAERLFGWRIKEIRGKAITYLLPSLHEQDYTRGKDVIGLHKNGRSMPVHLTIGKAQMPENTFYVAVVGDIAERKQFETALRESEEKFRSLVGNLPGISYRCLPDKDWTMLYISDAVERFTGYPAKAFMRPGGITFSDIVHPDDRERIGLHILNSDKVFEVEYRIIHKDGRILWVWENGSLITNDVGEIVWLDGVILDISQRYEMEQVLRHEKIKAEQAVAVKTEFLANMSHEIRTPMNAIIGFIDILLQTPLSEEQKQYLDTINHASGSLLHLLNDVLDTAKLERGVVELEEVNFSLTELLYQVLATFKVNAEQKGLALRLEYASGMGEFFRGDEQRLRQVLVNLIGNAVKFTERGEVVVNVSADVGFIGFAIRDSGIGIAADRLQHIFEPFTQADASMTRRFGGSGLGTTISKQLIELMGGTISVTSELGKGSVFSFRIPLLQGEIHTRLPDRQLLALPPLRILVVDDVVPNVQLLDILLRKGGHQVTAVMDGAEALAVFQQRTFDVVLMDVQMPVMDGLESSRLMRQHEQANQLKPTPIIALTASVLDADKLAAREAGMDGFATKPINLFELQSEMARLLGLTVQTQVCSSSNPVSAPVPISLSAGLALWQSETFYYNALRQFIAENRALVENLEAALKLQNVSAVAQLLHRARGAAVNLALPALADVLKHIAQIPLEQLHGDTWLKQRDELQSVFDQLVAAVNALPQLREMIAPQLLIDPAHSALAITQLKTALGRGELDEASLRLIKQAFRADAHQIIIGRIQQAMMDFEFSAALRHLDTLQQQLADT
ncbi:MHYT domain-containing protein [Cellvibrio sp. ARAG 10.3]|uniref:MHYT domain-containing protein n=1 Tax=Cellvibrio sp. ARAG 10.3 TaxID=3451358 RepID=UPI003F4889F4